MSDTGFDDLDSEYPCLYFDVCGPDRESFNLCHRPHGHDGDHGNKHYRWERLPSEDQAVPRRAPRSRSQHRSPSGWNNRSRVRRVPLPGRRG